MVSKLKLEQLTDSERNQFLELVHESRAIKTHFTLYLWLRGSLQQLLPHDILIAAWGDFSNGTIYYDVISALPGVRTRKVTDDDLSGFLSRLYIHWEKTGCNPSLLSIGECINPRRDIEGKGVARHFGNMKSVLVHAIKDFRGRSDCLYVLLSKEGTHPKRVCTVFEALLPHIDASLRKVPHLPEQVPHPAPARDAREPDLEGLSGITPREAEIMRLVRVGKTNVEIGMILDISVFTVKNHLQHIFKKLNVNNRAQAVSKF